ncbi:hypothetical protein DUT91_19345 [Phyllobacterium salinisoli]|uniref:Uncharacterized protein n=1 Tax=Phyllobacterium salinisoli TaxID=1899321 RepID=A0A368JYF1_9HYPH|nr:hypothetical protein DUT91_19345 [Phyllobacterium salinisoli]
MIIPTMIENIISRINHIDSVLQLSSVRIPPDDHPWKPSPDFSACQQTRCMEEECFFTLHPRP